MKRIMILLLLILSISIIACTTTPNGALQGQGGPGQNLNTPGESQDLHEHIALDEFPMQEIDSIELEGLIQMREEEKLARDVYTTLYDLWGQQTFNNIAQSENTHTLEVKALLDRYGIEDPVKDNSVGVFSSSEMQSLYDSLVEQGSTSLVDALTVGALVEDLDIKDLEELILKTDNEDIIYTYTNLRMGSENHIRSFTRQLENNGASYTPSYITQEQYDFIISQDHTGSGVKGQGLHQ